MELSELFEQALEQQYKHEQWEKETVIISKPEDIEKANFHDIQINSVSISHMYQGPLPDLSSAINIRRMQVNCVHTWEEVLDSIPPFAEELQISVPANSLPEKITNPLLKSLTIEFYNTEMPPSPGDKYSIDFSGIPKIEKLTIFNAQRIDLNCFQSLSELEYLKCTEIKDPCITIPHLPSLTALHIRGLFSSVILTSKLPRLKVLILEADQLVNIDFIRYFPSLEHIELYCPEVVDISVTDDLPDLNYIHCRCREINDTGKLLQRQKVTTILTERDRDLEYIKKHLPSYNTFMLMRRLKLGDEQLAKIHFSSPLNIDIINNHNGRYADALRRAKTRASMTREERFGSLLQSEFETQYFNTVTPFNPRFDVYEPLFKEYYIENASKKYPFLQVTDLMKQQVLRESRPFSGWIKEFNTPGNIVFICKDIIFISLKMSAGTGEFTINTTQGKRNANSSFRKEFFLRAKLFPDFNPKNYDYTINLTQYYSSDMAIDDCVLPIILAIQSIRDSIIFRSDTVLGVKFPDKYQNKRSLFTSPMDFLCARVAALNGFSRIILTGKKDFQNDAIESIYCKQLDDILQALSRK